MSVPTDFFETLAQSSIEVRARLKTDPRIGPYIDDTLPIPQPFGARNSSPIKLVVIGQDPTVGSAKTRTKSPRPDAERRKGKTHRVSDQRLHRP